MINRNMRRTRTYTLVLATCLLCLTRSIVCDVGIETNKNSGNSQNDKEPRVLPAVAGNSSGDVTKSNKNNNDDKKNSTSSTAAVETKENFNKTIVTSNGKTPVVKAMTGIADAESTSKKPELPIIGHTTSLNPGAMLRGFYVLVGLSVMALGYMVFRSFRLNKPRTQMVRKYGVLAHKQDIEMRPLPLDEDDEDDTIVFDASGLSPSRS